MNDVLLQILTTAAPLAVLIVTAIAAVQKRVPKLEGWPVLVVAAVLSLVIAALFLPITTVAEAVSAGRVALVSWLFAVGGDAWASKIAGKASTTLVRTVIAETPPEAP